MERCPCCNARLGKVISCPRCQADLTVLNNVEQMAKLWLKKAINYWLDNHLEKSLDALMLSLRLKKQEWLLLFKNLLSNNNVKTFWNF